MSIKQISGKLRQGKGVLMVYFVLRAVSRGYRVLTNFNVSLPNCVKMDYYDFLYLLKAKAPDVPTLIAIDELPTWIDSYTSTTSESNRMAGHFCNQSAKLGYDLVYTAQRTKRADINYRAMVTDSFRAEKFNLCNKRKCPMDCQYLGKCHFHYALLDPEFIDEDIPLSNKSFNFSFKFASKWWGLFDTFEPVIPMGLDEFLTKMEKSDPERLKKAVDRQIEVLRVGGYVPRTLAQTKYCLLDCGESVVFADLVYAGLTLR